MDTIKYIYRSMSELGFPTRRYSHVAIAYRFVEGKIEYQYSLCSAMHAYCKRRLRASAKIRLQNTKPLVLTNSEIKLSIRNMLTALLHKTVFAPSYMDRISVFSVDDVSHQFVEGFILDRAKEQIYKQYYS